MKKMRPIRAHLCIFETNVTILKMLKYNKVFIHSFISRIIPTETFVTFYSFDEFNFTVKCGKTLKGKYVSDHKPLNCKIHSNQINIILSLTHPGDIKTR